MPKHQWVEMEFTPVEPVGMEDADGFRSVVKLDADRGSYGVCCFACSAGMSAENEFGECDGDQQKLERYGLGVADDG